MANKKQSKLFVLNQLDTKDDQEDKMEKCFDHLSTQLKGLSDNESNEKLISMASQGLHDDVCQALIYGMLTNPAMAQKYYRELTFVTRDSYNFALTKVNWIIIEMIHKLTDLARNQLLWFIREAIKHGINYMDNVCINLLRNIAGGDISAKNVTLASEILTLLSENRAWMEKNPLLVSCAVYCYLRLIPDHSSATLETLRQKEILFCVSLLREKWMDCLRIGRDLVRSLVMLGRIPEIERLWQDIVSNPSSLSPSFTGVQQLLSLQSSRKIILSRVTIEMERRIFYVLSAVRHAQQKHYLDWLQRDFLSTPESQSLRSDWIRYVCTCIHPTNEILASDIVPRWSFIFWLMSTCTNSVEAQHCKLALFFDWFCFDPEKESIMNIEPGILLMYNSLRSQPAMATSLLEFLCRGTVNFCSAASDYLKHCVYTSIRQILEKRVVVTMAPLFENPKLDRDLKTMVHEVFGEFITTKDVPEEVPTTSRKVEEDLLMIVETDRVNSESGNGTEDGDVEAEFSDDETDTSSKVNESADMEFKPRRSRKTTELYMWDSDGDLIIPFDDPKPADINEHLAQLDESFRPLVEELLNVAEDNMARCDRMQKLLMGILSKDDVDVDQYRLLAECLTGLFLPFFARRVFPDDASCESDFEESISVPFFVIFRNLCMTPGDDDSREPLLRMLACAYERQPRIGYLLLYFLKTSTNLGDKATAYNDYVELCDYVEDDDLDLDAMLLKDLTLCQQEDYKLFLHLVPDIYRKFSQIATSNPDLMRLVVSTIDSTQLQDLVFEIVQGNLRMFKRDSRVINSLLTASLEWETIEQYFLWQLLAAEEISPDMLWPLMPKLHYPKHTEAMTNITLLVFKQLDKEPTAPLVRALFHREPYVKGDYFTASNLKILIDGYEEKMVTLVGGQLSKLATSETTTSSKGKKQAAAKGPTLEQMLGHLDVFRRYCNSTMCSNFFSKEIVQTGMTDVRRSASDNVRLKFSELFAMMDILVSCRDGRSTRRGRKPVPAVSRHAGGDSSDDDEPTGTRSTPKKKRKVEFDDSD